MSKGLERNFASNILMEHVRNFLKDYDNLLKSHPEAESDVGAMLIHTLVNTISMDDIRSGKLSEQNKAEASSVLMMLLEDKGEVRFTMTQQAQIFSDHYRDEGYPTACVFGAGLVNAILHAASFDMSPITLNVSRNAKNRKLFSLLSEKVLRAIEVAR